MRSHCWPIAVLLSLALLHMGCSHAPSPVEPVAGGTLYGVTWISDEYMNFRTDRRGMVVTARSTTWSGSDTTNADGSWSIHGVPAGVYTMTVTKEGCSTSTLANVQFVGADSLQVNISGVHMPIAADIVSGATASISWIYKYHHEGPDVPYDSTVSIDVIVSTNLAGDVALRFNVTETPDADCDSYVVFGSGDLQTSSTSVRTYNLFDICSKLRDHYGKTLPGRTLYLQIRPWNLADANRTCFPPCVVTLKL